MTAKSINLALQNAFWSIKEIKEILCYTSFVYIFTQEIPSAMNTIIVESCKNFFVSLSNQPQAKKNNTKQHQHLKTPFTHIAT